jgi:putative hydrolase of the HAD superfamily
MTDKGLALTPDVAFLRLSEVIKRRGSNHPHHFDLLVEEVMGEKNDKIVAAGIIAYHNTKFANMAPYRDSVPSLIELKQMGLSLNVITNGRSVKQWEKILRLGLEAFFDHVVISEKVGHSKPGQEIYRIALNLRRCEPDEALCGQQPRSACVAPRRWACTLSSWTAHKRGRLPTPPNYILSISQRLPAS